MQQKVFVLFILPLIWTSCVVQGSSYPDSWIRKGECLDMNEGPLLIGVKPQINQNIINSTKADNFGECVSQCKDYNECRFVTFYKDTISLAERTDQNKTCKLVGFNMGNACFNLEDTCILLKRCILFDGNCTTCQTGMRPVYKPEEEPLTLVMNGLDDNRDWKDNNLDQYIELDSVELIKNDGSTCELTAKTITKRYGNSAAYVNNMIVNCGGISSAVVSANGSSYLNTCEKLTGATAAWASMGTLTVARAFAGIATVPGDVVYILGGYNKDNGFLDSAEKLASGAAAFTPEATMNLPEKKSHFCLVMASADKDGEEYLYAIGGWNMYYLKSVHRIKMSATGAGDAAGWQEFPSMQAERADHACAEVQVDSGRKGIVASGGYRNDGAWLSSVEFLDYETGKWSPLVFFPRLSDGRHYHGLTTIEMFPTVFGGWNNGSLNTMEMLTGSNQEFKWSQSNKVLIQQREKFGYARVPSSFISTC